MMGLNNSNAALSTSGFCALLFSVLYGTTVKSQEFSLPKDVDIYKNMQGLSNVDLGKGYSGLQLMFNDRIRRTCVTGVPRSIDSLSGGKTIGYLKTVSTQTELYNNVDQSLSIEGKTKLVNFNGVSSLLEVMSYNYKHSYAFVFIKKEFLPRNLSAAKLDVDISKYASVAEFVDHCGDNYISTYVSGSYALGAVDCETTTRETQRKANDELSKISGSIQNGKLSGAGSLKLAREEIAKSTGSECRLWSQFDGGKGLISSDPDKFIDSLWTYAQSGDDKSATVLSIGFDSYNNSANPGKELDFTKKIWSLISPAAGDIDRYRKRIALRADEIEGTVNLMGVVSGSEFEKLAVRKSELESEIAELEKWATACANEPYRSWEPGRCGMR